MKHKIVLEDINLSKAVQFYGINRVAQTAGVDRGGLSRLVKGIAVASPKRYESLKKAVGQLEKSVGV